MFEKPTTEGLIVEETHIGQIQRGNEGIDFGASTSYTGQNRSDAWPIYPLRSDLPQVRS